MSERAFPPTLSVLGTSQNSGKTVTCIGLLCKLLAPPYNLEPSAIGYMKPVGQHVVSLRAVDGSWTTAERDAALVTTLMGMGNSRYDLISPIVWSAGRTMTCIDDACRRGAAAMRASHVQALQNAYRQLANDKRAMIIEGTGQIGVGSVGGISAADTILALREMGVPVHVLLVTQGDPVHAIAETMPHLLALARFGICIDGLIVNRVDPNRVAETSAILRAFYECELPRLYGERCGLDQGIQIIGLVPEMPDLALPTMRLLREYLAGLPGACLQVYAWPSQPEPERIFARRTVALSLRERYLPLLRDGDLVVVGINANARILSLLDHQRAMQHAGRSGLAGILLSCQAVGGLLPETRTALQKARIPVLAVSLDTARVVQEIADMTVKIQPYDAGKRDLIAGAYCQHIGDLPGLIPQEQPVVTGAPGGSCAAPAVPPCSCPACREAVG